MAFWSHGRPKRRAAVNGDPPGRRGAYKTVPSGRGSGPVAPSGRDADGPEALASEIDVVERVRSRYDDDTHLSFGAPTRCPRCADYGLVEHVDMSAQRVDNRCLRCGTEWTISLRALLALDHEPAAALPPTAAALRRSRALEERLAPHPELDGLLFSRTEDGEVAREFVRAATAPLPPQAGTPWAHPVLPLRVLLVEDDPDDVAVVRALLESAGPDLIDLRTASTRAAGEAAANANVADVVLLDLTLPDSDGVETAAHWHDKVGPTPVLVMGDGTELADRKAELGVVGVVGKAELARYLARGDEGTTAFLDLLGASCAGGPLTQA